MMQIYIAEPGSCLQLGHQGESEARAIQFDLTPFEQLFPGGTPQLLVQRPLEDTPYLAELRVEEHTAFWCIRAADSALHGFGACELQWRIGSVLAKSEVYETYIQPSMSEPSETPPAAAEEWVSSVLQAAQTVQQASVHAPVVGENGNWFYWNAEDGAYTIDSGKASKGEAGNDGRDGLTSAIRVGGERFTQQNGVIDIGSVYRKPSGGIPKSDLNPEAYASIPVASAILTSGTRGFEATIPGLTPVTGTLIALVFDHSTGGDGANVKINGLKPAYLRLANMKGGTSVVRPPENWFISGMPYLFQYYDRRTESKPNDIYLMCVTPRAAATDLDGVVAIANGGTGASTAAQARQALGIDTAIANAISALRQELGME